MLLTFELWPIKFSLTFFLFIVWLQFFVKYFIRCLLINCQNFWIFPKIYLAWNLLQRYTFIVVIIITQSSIGGVCWLDFSVSFRICYWVIYGIQVQLKILAEEMQAISKGLEKVIQELSMSENDGAVSENFCKVSFELLFTYKFSTFFFGSQKFASTAHCFITRLWSPGNSLILCYTVEPIQLQLANLSV